jgi:hypothetical protein
MQNCGHTIEFCSIAVLDEALDCMDRLINEAIETRLYPRHFNRDRDFNLSVSPGTGWLI